MHDLLQRLLRKKGIEDTSTLDESEKKTFDTWQGVLSEGDMSVDRIRQFCQFQLGNIEGKWKDLDNSDQKNQRLIITHTVYKAILDCIEKPAHERENLEKYLQNLIDM